MTNTEKSLSKGFTIIEVIIATLLMTTVGAAVLTSFLNASRLSTPSELAAVYDIRGSLGQLYESVRQDTWNSGGNPLSLGTHNSTVVIDGRTYTRSYVVTSVTLGGSEAYRKVVATDSWTP